MYSIMYSVVVMQFGDLDVLQGGVTIRTGLRGVQRSMVMFELDHVRLRRLCMVAFRQEGIFARLMNVHELGIAFLVIKIIAMVPAGVQANGVLDGCPPPSAWQALVQSRGGYGPSTGPCRGPLGVALRASERQHA